VQKIEGRLWGYYYDSVLKANYTFMVPADREIVPGEIVVGPALERTRGLAAGNGISFRAYSGELHTFIVAEVLPHESELVSADLVLMNEADFRRFFAYPDGHYTDIALWVANPLEVRNVALKLLAALPDSRPILREEVLRTYASIFDWREGMMLALLSAAILAFGILAWEKAAGLSAEEKREIGILKAIGWETGDVIAMKFWEGFLVSLFAFLVGYVAAYVHVFHFEFTAVRAGAQGLGGALPALRAHAADRRPAGGDAVRVHRAALHRGGAGADLARGDHRPRHRDAELTRCSNSPTSARCSTRAAQRVLGAQGHRPGDPAGAKVSVLKGPSGSGKTTLLTILGCLARPTEGRVRLNGEDISGLPERFLTEIRRRTFGFIFQQFNLIKGLSALENIILPATPAARRARNCWRAPRPCSPTCKLAHRRDAKVEWLSGGEQQRVAICRALINDPRC
jgi:hypothetical protein